LQAHRGSPRRDSAVGVVAGAGNTGGSIGPEVPSLGIPSTEPLESFSDERKRRFDEAESEFALPESRLCPPTSAAARTVAIAVVLLKAESPCQPGDCLPQVLIRAILRGHSRDSTLQTQRLDS
jgi:hypothetical protein